MSESTPPEPAPPEIPTPPQASLRRRRFAFVWLIPLLAAGLAIYLGYRTYLQQGPELTLLFDNADGLTAGTTQVKYKAVALGTVDSIDLSKDNSHVVVHVQMNQVGKRFLTSHARFWVEGAHISPTNPSSLGSFVSGAFISVDPGRPGGHFQNTFVGLNGPPAVRSDEPGRSYTLITDRLGSLDSGSPVMYRGAQIGEVLGYDLGNGFSPIKLSVFVRAPFDDLIRPKTRFWNGSGITLGYQPGQIHAEIESLQALFAGAVALYQPPDVTSNPPSSNGATFELYNSKEDAEAASYVDKLPAVAYFNSSVSGLRPGSPVQILGIQVGIVTDIRLVVDIRNSNAKVRVAMALQPQRALIRSDIFTHERIAELLQNFIDHGLRAELASGNLLTGDKIISLDIVPGAKPMKLTQEGDAFVLPSKAQDLNGIMSSLADITAKLDQIPYQKVGQNLNALLATANSTLASPQTKQALASFSASLKSLNTTLTMLNENYGNDSDFQHNFQLLLQQANTALGSLKELSDYLNRHPNALLFGRGAHE